MNPLTVELTTKNDLCVSCAVCAAACPVAAIHMQYGRGQFLPAIEYSKCTKCGFCLEVCPGVDINPLKIRSVSELLEHEKNRCLAAYTAYAQDDQIRKNSTSGGVITALVAALLESHDYDRAFLLNFDKFSGAQAELKPACDKEAVLKAARSKYVPVSVFHVIETLKKKDGKKSIIVGTSCQFQGILSYMKKANISRDNLLFLGLFCEKTMNFNILRYFEDRFKKGNEKIANFYFRIKEKNGWPGDSKIVFDSGRGQDVSRDLRMSLKKYFQLNRCLFCLDKLNLQADIAFGDCYVKGEEDYKGKSSVIVRTVKGMDIIKKKSALFSLQETPLGEIIRAQHLMGKELNLNFVKSHVFQRELIENMKFSFAQMISLKAGLFSRQMLIRTGEHYQKPVFILLSILAGLKSAILKIGKRGAKYFYGLYCCFVLVLYASFHSNRKRNKMSQGDSQEKKHILVVGGELFNKGAQAMTFVVVDQMRKRYPEKRVILLSGRDHDRPRKEKEMYAFGIYPWNRGLKLSLLGLNKAVPYKNKHIVATSDLAGLLDESAFIVDISGYALSSQWGALASFDYLCNIAIAEKFDVPYYIFPQSMGPFNYDLLCRQFLIPLIKLSLVYPREICVREKNGYEHARRFTQKNLVLRSDIVLCGGEIDLNNVYLRQPDFRFIDVVKGSVGIIPNQRVVERVDESALLGIYEAWINKLLQAGKKAYLLRHSYEDLKICSQIKEKFINNPDVILLSDDFNAIEIEDIIKQFDFIIASRYHAIVHAYKNGVPVLVLGWAVKYAELVARFRQSEYFLDCRQGVHAIKALAALDELMSKHREVSDVISLEMRRILKENVEAKAT